MAGFFRQIEISRHDAGAAQIDHATSPVFQDLVVIADFYLKAGHRSAAINEMTTPALRIFFIHHYHLVVIREVVAVNMVCGEACPKG